jgi:thiamine-monophosphate kinase
MSNRQLNWPTCYAHFQDHDVSLSEFDLIARYFTRPPQRAVLGVGDDCALIQPAPGMQLAISTDMLVEGCHFFSDLNPQHLGHKALAVNLSDLAACGAQPLAFTLALALPHSDATFLEPFARGLLRLADTHQCELIGGDTTRGPLTISITVFGEVPPGQALLRSGARAGDSLYVSGSLGDARLALDALRGQIHLSDSALAQARIALEQPQPRIALGLALRGLASSVIDLSDGLVGDLSQLLRRSQVGARVNVDALPIGAVLRSLSPAQQRQSALAGGDDYELLFTAAPHCAAQLPRIAAQTGVAITHIGQVEADAGLRLVDAQGQNLAEHYRSFDHFTP